MFQWCWVPILTNISISNGAHQTIMPIKFVGNTKQEGLHCGECFPLKKKTLVHQKKKIKSVRLNLDNCTMLMKGQMNVVPKENNWLGKYSWKELRVKVGCSLHMSQLPKAAAAEERNAILQGITSSKECKTQGADTLILQGTPEASAELCIWLGAALLNCREPKIAQRNEVVLKKIKPLTHEERLNPSYLFSLGKRSGGCLFKS